MTPEQEEAVLDEIAAANGKTPEQFRADIEEMREKQVFHVPRRPGKTRASAEYNLLEQSLAIQNAPQAPLADRRAAAEREARLYGTDPSWFGV